jgi:hypothetical protein
MTKTVDIQPVSRSAYDAAANDKLKTLLDELVRVVRNAANWKVRKKTLLDIIAELEAVTCALHQMSHEEEEKAASDKEDPETFFIQTLPMYIGVILEKLAEPKITCIEQAAFLHDQHPSRTPGGLTGLDRRRFPPFQGVQTLSGGQPLLPAHPVARRGSGDGEPVSDR